MAAPVASMIQLPLDTGNTGKKVRSQTRVIGADTVHAHYFIPQSDRSTLGEYKYTSAVLTVPAAVHTGQLTGFLWIANPVGSAVKVAVKRITVNTQFSALAVDLLPGELRFSRMTFTGVNSGAQITPAKRDSTDAANVGNVWTTSATWAVTLGGTAYAMQHQTMDLITGGGGHWNPFLQEWNPDREAGELILRAGEGISIWHAVAVTTANRRMIISIATEEFE